ncbi:MAG: trigger factor [bacterium]
MAKLISVEDRINYVYLNFCENQKKVDDYLTKRKQELTKDVQVPGYRAGKAPQHLLAQYVDLETIQAEIDDDEVNFLMSQIEDFIKNPQTWLPDEHILFRLFFPINQITRVDGKVNFQLIAQVLPILDIEPIFKDKPKIPEVTEAMLVKDGWLAKADFENQAFINLCEEFNLWKEVSRPAKLWDKVIVSYELTDSDDQDGTYLDEQIIISLDDEERKFNEMFIGLRARDKTKKTLEVTGLQGSTKQHFSILCKKVFEPKYSSFKQAFENELKLKKHYSSEVQYSQIVSQEYQEQFDELREMYIDDAYNDIIREYVTKNKLIKLPLQQINTEAENILEQLKQISEIKNQDIQKTFDEEVIVTKFLKPKTKVTEAAILEMLKQQASQNYGIRTMYNLLGMLCNPQFYVQIKFMFDFKPEEIIEPIRSKFFQELESIDEEDRSEEPSGEGLLGSNEMAYLNRVCADEYILNRYYE